MESPNTNDFIIQRGEKAGISLGLMNISFREKKLGIPHEP
jgi:hypothetical protein